MMQRIYTTRFIVLFSLLLLSGSSFGQRRPGGKPTIPTIILNAVVDHATCFNDVGCIDYSLTTSSGWGKGWSVNSMRVYNDQNVLVHTHGSGFTGDICGLSVGRYRFTGSVTVRNSSGYMVSVPFTFYEWLGVETNWAELKDMVASPNSYSATRNSSNLDYGGALSSNYIASGDAWIQMSADYGTTANSYVYWIIGETNDISSFIPNGSQQYVTFYNTSSGSGINVRYFNGTNYSFSSISTNSSDLIRLVRIGSTLTLQINNSPNTVFTFPTPYIGALNIGVFAKTVNNAAIDDVSSMPCRISPSMISHAKVEKRLTSGYTFATGSILKIVYEGEYDTNPGSKLNYV
ncbi:MAG: hypothetical protein MK105_12555, partial [Crocinitomicaceae bacterium]|nr:hypothetical protein [Crocinitomicaceae bacterium]